MKVAIQGLSRRLGAPGAQGYTPRAKGFPWLLCAFSWLMLFPLWNKLDSPITWLDAQSASNLAQGVKEGSPIARIVIIALGVIGVVLLAKNWRRVRLNQPFASLFFAYFGWTMLSGLWADDHAIGTRRLVSLALMLIFSGGCAILLSARHLSIFLAAIPALYLIPGFVSELVYGTFHPFDSESRFVGTSPHPNVEAATLAVATVLLFWLAWQARAGARLCIAFIALISTAFLLDTGSRTALLALAASLIFTMALILIRDYWKRLPLILATCTLGFSLFSLANLYLENTSGGAIGVNSLHASRDEGDVTSFNGRLSLWRTLMTFALERPIQGYGYGSFWSPKHIDYVSAEQGWAIQQSHSSYIEEVLELGFTGALLYVALLANCLITCVIRFMCHDDSYGAWAAVMVVIAVHNATEAINVIPLFTNFAVDLILMHMALISPVSPGELSCFKQRSFLTVTGVQMR